MDDRAEIALHAGLVVAVLAAAVFGIVSVTAPAPLEVARATPVAPDASLLASTAPSAAPSPTPTPGVAVTPAPASPTPRPTPVARPYSFGGRAYTGVEIRPEVIVVAPYAASVEIHVYQLVSGEIREGANAEGIPSYPYVILDTADRRLVYRPGQLDRDVVLVARGGPVAAGAPLFRIVGNGKASWFAFYDASIPFQIVMSLVATASGADLDAAPLLRTR